MWSRLARPMGPRASAMVSSMPNSRNTSTNAAAGAREPKSTTVPDQSKITAAIAISRLLLSAGRGDKPAIRAARRRRSG